MDWLDHMNAAMDYIEAHLADEIFYDQAARLACCSTYHFQRMVSYLTGVPLAEYIRRRRLTLAAFELRGGKCKVIDVALKYGYESPEAFSRASKSCMARCRWPRARRAFRSKPIRGCASTSPFRGIKK